MAESKSIPADVGRSVGLSVRPSVGSLRRNFQGPDAESVGFNNRVLLKFRACRSACARGHRRPRPLRTYTRRGRTAKSRGSTRNVRREHNLRRRYLKFAQDSESRGGYKLRGGGGGGLRALRGQFRTPHFIDRSRHSRCCHHRRRRCRRRRTRRRRRRRVGSGAITVTRPESRFATS